MKTLEKLKTMVSPMRKDQMIYLTGGYTYCHTGCSSTSHKGGAATSDCTDGSYD
jgi:hypothetical protein